MLTETKVRISKEDEKALLDTLKERFEKNRYKHKGIDWEVIQSRLEMNPEKISSLYMMEQTGGEPDVIGFHSRSGKYIFCDCSPETPEGRRNTCYDNEGEQERIKKGINPSGNAVDMATDMGIELMDEEQYRELQGLGDFDKRTSSWLKTPPAIRELGGAIFADLRYGKVFIYHNGAQSFYSTRGFRGLLRV
ncbi:MAG TPA: DUF4256 domain-containing protein [Bacteroidales bacterium]|nr:DUF4256 domain-containing protein [Bacteroidales bacterium]